MCHITLRTTPTGGERNQQQDMQKKKKKTLIIFNHVKGLFHHPM